MSLVHERFVAARFDALEARFKAAVPDSDFRLAAVVRALGAVDGTMLLDLGCGKGRFAGRLVERGARVVGLDLSAGMLAQARLADRVRGSMLRLPFATATFDSAVAIDVFQHLPASRVDRALAEIRRVLRPGGRLVIVDKNALALDDRRPWLPRVVVKRIDEWRGRWMYRPGEPVREHWFRPEVLRRQLERHLVGVGIEYLLSPAESGHRLFERHPRRRALALWTGRVAGESS